MSYIRGVNYTVLTDQVPQNLVTYAGLETTDSTLIQHHLIQQHGTIQLTRFYDYDNLKYFIVQFKGLYTFCSI